MGETHTITPPKTFLCCYDIHNPTTFIYAFAEESSNRNQGQCYFASSAGKTDAIMGEAMGLQFRDHVLEKQQAAISYQANISVQDGRSLANYYRK